MDLERRTFLGKAAVLGTGLFAPRSAHSWEKEMLSDPVTPRQAATGLEVIELPAFEKNSTFILDDALVNRKSSRSFTDMPLSTDELSHLFWAMNGVNRPYGRRTTPSALGAYPVDVYSALPEGVYRYETDEHQLVPVLSEDIRSDIPTQPDWSILPIQPEGLKKAAMIQLYVADMSKVPLGMVQLADIEIGCMVQNLYLEAASLGLGACVFGYLPRRNISRRLGLKYNQKLRIAQAVGPLE